MINITGGKKEQIVREWFNETYEGVVPTRVKVLDLFQEFDAGDRPEDISYGLFNGVIKKIVAEGHYERSEHTASVHSVVEPEVIKVEDMQFPAFGLFRTGKKIDDLFSDHEEGGGIINTRGITCSDRAFFAERRT